MIEYEYSFIVDNNEPYINYCLEKKYKKISENYQIRKLYTSPNKILARLTTIIQDNKETTTLDFKDEDDSIKVLKSARETIPLKVTKANKQSINSILEILNYKLHKTLKRNRIIFKKNNVIFEIDKYLEPEECFVVAIEGAKEEVDKVYQDLEYIINNTKLDN